MSHLSRETLDNILASEEIARALAVIATGDDADTSPRSLL